MVSSDGTSSAALITSDGAVQGGGGGGGASGAGLGDLDTTYSPEALYLFNGDETDSSGNGHNLTVENGAAQYVSFMGKQWFFCDGTNSLYRPSDTGNALDEYGDITLTAHLRFLNETSNTCWIVGHGGEGSAAAQNWQYAMTLSGTQFRWFHEYGTGTGASDIFAAFAKTTLRGPVVYTVVRDATARTIKHYIEGILFETDTFGAGEDPTDGASAEFRLFSSATGNFLTNTLVRNVGVYKSALSDAQVLAIANTSNGG